MGAKKEFERILRYIIKKNILSQMSHLPFVTVDNAATLYVCLRNSVAYAGIANSDTML